MLETLSLSATIYGKLVCTHTCCGGYQHPCMGSLLVGREDPPNFIPHVEAIHALSFCGHRASKVPSQDKGELVYRVFCAGFSLTEHV